MRDGLLGACVGSAHFVATFALIVYTFGSGMARFDSLAPATLLETLAKWVLVVLFVPLLTVLDRVPGLRFPGWWGYVPLMANAALWGWAAVAVRRWLRARTARRGRASG